ncbi:hypothetical protein K4P42_11575 [Staphylococcus epidermidis]|uniref:hypothetical protein n=1 Tax=Staphylococcus epidermidis TaxID=1282 RepID=UPI000F455CC5|nr:hypothetical protein [Staphylococcus epidermidis]MBM0772963.1 hypothetical protein [Staphylococcus epidermidis]MCG2504027.1 hypothetical protein [Staphylococcus epidermidis]RNM19582.1 hypothetical protein EFY84_11630 [Staphylococcus epidermidis]
MNKVNQFFKALVLAIMVRCTMNYLLPTPEKLIFKILDGLVFGISTFILIVWFTEVSKKNLKK